MHEPVFVVLLLWHAVLLAVLAREAYRARGIVGRALALDTLAVAFVSALVLVAIDRKEAGYVDVALVVGLLGFAQTVATARIAEARGEELDV